MIKILKTYPDKSPQIIEWFRDGNKVNSFLRYEEVNEFSEYRISYSVWGTIFNMKTGEAKSFDKRFYVESAAQEFYTAIMLKYPQSRVEIAECITLKKYS